MSGSELYYSVMDKIRYLRDREKFLRLQRKGVTMTIGNVLYVNFQSKPN